MTFEIISADYGDEWVAGKNIFIRCQRSGSQLSPHYPRKIEFQLATFDNVKPRGSIVCTCCCPLWSYKLQLNVSYDIFISVNWLVCLPRIAVLCDARQFCNMTRWVLKLILKFFDIKQTYFNSFSGILWNKYKKQRICTNSFPESVRKLNIEIQTYKQARF